MGALCTGVLGPYDFNDAENSGRNLVKKKRNLLYSVECYGICQIFMNK